MIQKRGGRWRVVVQAGPDPISGRRRQLSGSAPTQREARDLERELWAKAEQPVGGRLPLRRLADEWWEDKPRLAPSTMANYRSNRDVHILPVLGDTRLEGIRPRLVRSFLRHLAEKGLEPGTIRKVRTVLSALMSYAVAMEYAESNAVMKVPLATTRTPTYQAIPGAATPYAAGLVEASIARSGEERTAWELAPQAQVAPAAAIAHSMEY